MPKKIGTRTMKKKKGISFVIPAYNADRWLADCIKSICEGNVDLASGDEVIVINDGSVDGTLEVAEAMANVYEGVKVLDNHGNIGCPASRNVGISQAKNPWIMNVDADNILLKGSIYGLRQYMELTKADICHFGGIRFFIGERTHCTHQWIFPAGQLRLEDLFAGHINPGPAGNFLHTKAGWEEVGGYWEFDEGTHEAWGYSFKRLAFGHKFMIMPAGFYLHRDSPESLYYRRNRLDSSHEITNKFVEEYMFLFEDNDKMYMEENEKTWFKAIATRPINLMGRTKGKTGIRVSM